MTRKTKSAKLVPTPLKVDGLDGKLAGTGWIGVDLDGTLAHYTHWVGPLHIGSPIPAMVSRVKLYRIQGQDIRIFTARAGTRIRKPSRQSRGGARSISEKCCPSPT